jgi:hypothetical protein
MVLYYIDNELFVDFQTIVERVDMPISNIYRILKKRCKGIPYRNRTLYEYKDLMNLPDIFHQVKRDEVIR